MRPRTLIVILMAILILVTGVTQAAVHQAEKAKAKEEGVVIRSASFVEGNVLPSVEKSDTTLELEGDILNTPENFMTHDGKYGIYTPLNKYSGGGNGIQMILISKDGRDIEYSISHKKGEVKLGAVQTVAEEDSPGETSEAAIEETGPAEIKVDETAETTAEAIVVPLILRVKDINNNEVAGDIKTIYFKPGDVQEQRLHFTAKEVATGWIQSSFDIVIKKTDGVYRISKIVE